jgi:hypothetical protein
MLGVFGDLYQNSASYFESGDHKAYRKLTQYIRLHVTAQSKGDLVVQDIGYQYKFIYAALSCM